MSPPLLTCEAVLTETAYLLSRYPRRLSSMLEVWRRGLVRVEFSAQHQREALFTLSERYANVPISFADACLVRMSELHTDCRIWTLDADFKIYRRNGRQMIPLLMPAAPA